MWWWRATWEFESLSSAWSWACQHLTFRSLAEVICCQFLKSETNLKYHFSYFSMTEPLANLRQGENSTIEVTQQEGKCAKYGRRWGFWFGDQKWWRKCGNVVSASEFAIFLKFATQKRISSRNFTPFHPFDHLSFLSFFPIFFFFSLWFAEEWKFRNWAALESQPFDPSDLTHPLPPPHPFPTHTP